MLVRYNPEADPALNQRQTARLTELSEYCRAAGRRFIFELLVPATQAQMDRVQADQATYDLRVRPALMLRTIRQVLAANGVDVMLAEHDEYTPSPVVSHVILTHNRGRAAGLADRIVVTPSHNPPNDGRIRMDPSSSTAGRKGPATS